MATAARRSGGEVDPAPTRAVVDAVLDQVPLGVVAIDAASGRVLIANREARRLFPDPQPLAALPDEHDWVAVASDGRAYEHQTWPIVRSLAGEAIDDEYVEILEGGKPRSFVELSSRPVRDAEGAIVAAVVVLRDVTVRAREERAMGDFVVNAAHQLQSPLAAIISSIEVLQAGAKDTDDRERFLGHLERESQRLARLVRTLLTLARAEMGSGASRRELIPLEPLIARVGADAAASARATVTVSCDPGLGVIANSDLIEQALAGIVDNAVNYAGEGVIEISGRRVGESVELAVADSGPGIPQDQQARVFDRFHRGGPAGGFGLGLAIVRAAVNALGGEIELESEPGAGTRMRIRLPGAATVTQ